MFPYIYSLCLYTYTDPEPVCVRFNDPTIIYWTVSIYPVSRSFMTYILIAIWSDSLRACSMELIWQSDSQKATSRHVCGGEGRLYITYILYKIYTYTDQQCIYGNRAFKFKFVWNALVMIWLTIYWCIVSIHTI